MTTGRSTSLPRGPGDTGRYSWNAKQVERLVLAFEQIAVSLTAIAKLESQRYEREYPEKPVRPASIAIAKYKKKLAQESKEEPLSRLGPREAAFQAKRPKV